MSTSRHVARIVVMQTIFEWEFRGTDISEIFARNIEIHKDRLEDHTYAETLLNGVMENYDGIKAIIGRVAPEWPINQISPVDRCVLYIAIYEMLFSKDETVPAIVAINEAIEIAKNFSGDNSGKFVNGALGTVLREDIGDVPNKEVPEKVAEEVAAIKENSSEEK